MLDFLMGVGFAFVIEGVLWGLFPHTITRLIKQISESDEQYLRLAGVGSLALGVVIIWYVQGLRVG